MERGQKENIEKLCGGSEFDIEVYLKISTPIDVTCFGLDAKDKLSNEEYFVFYNNEVSPDEAVEIVKTNISNVTKFNIKINKISEDIKKLSITAAIDGNASMKSLETGYMRISCNDDEKAIYPFTGKDFANEKAVIICEIYIKNDVWKVSAVGRGFNGGLPALVESFGGEVDPASVMFMAQGAGVSDKGNTSNVRELRPQSQPTTGGNVISLELAAKQERIRTKITDDTEYLEPIYKNVFNSLKQCPNTLEQPVKLVMITDISGSMYEMYRNGRVQRALDKLFPFASVLSNDCTMDYWAFAAKSKQFDTVTFDNVRSYTFDVAGGFERWMSMLNYQYNNEPEAMRDIMMIYGSSAVPVFVFFVTDGRINYDWEIEEILIKTARFPIFWQFIGINGNQYGILENLKTIDGRFSNNADFIRVNDIDDISENVLFLKLLNNMNSWVAEIKEKKIIK